MNKIALCLISLVPALSCGQELCTPNTMQVDVCRAAATITEAISEELPLRLSSGLVLQHIGAAQNVIRMRAVFDYTEADLIKASGTGAALDGMKESVRDAALVIACRPGTELQAFIELGGELQFVYLFSDAAHFLTVNVDQCNSEQAR